MKDIAEKQYYVWVDWVKTIGIFLVILGHEGLSSGMTKKFIYSFHMPLFFIVSGHVCPLKVVDGLYKFNN